jgi:hypothetical protein
MWVTNFNQINPKWITSLEKNIVIPSPPMYLSISLYVNVMFVEDYSSLAMRRSSYVYT